MALLKTFQALRSYIRGKIDSYDLMDEEPLINKVSRNDDVRGLSEFTIEFDSFSDLGKILGLSDDDIWFYNAITNPYYDYEFYDTEQAEENFTEGYGIWYYLDDDNVKILENISKYFLGEKFDIDDESSKKNLASKLIDYFPNEMNRIFSEFNYHKNDELIESAKESITPTLKEFIEKHGFKFYYGDQLRITAGNLYSLFIQNDAIHLSLKQLLEKIFENSDGEIGGWDEDRYLYENDDYFDKDRFNREVNWNLEKIVDKIEGDDDYGIDSFQSFKEMIDRITKKYKIGSWYQIPKDQNLLFRINGFDRESNQIDISLKKAGGPFKLANFKMSEDGFNKLLYQRELFKLEI